MKLNKKKKGFTLIELMAVIAIVAILAAVLVPTVSGYIDRSKKTALITQVRNVVNAVEVYNSTAPDSDKITNEVLSQLLPPTTRESQTPAIKQSFVNQGILVGKDVNKLNLSISYNALKALNNDENAMNNIYKKEVSGSGNSKSKKFFYAKVEDTSTSEIDAVAEVQLER